MSHHEARQFIEKIQRHDISPPALSPLTHRLADVVRLGARHGHHFTEAELRVVLKQAWSERWLRAKPKQG